MNSRLRRRLIVVTGVIVIVVVAVLAIVAGTTASRVVSVAEAASGSYIGTKVQVTGKVVDNSYAIDGNVLTFAIYDEDEPSQPQLRVSYDKGVSATFGNQVSAICTGVIDPAGILLCTELVTKCPSKYENSADALTVGQLLSYGEQIVGKPVKVTGALKAGTLSPVGGGERFVLVGEGSGDKDGASAAPADDSASGGAAPAPADGLPVLYDGALSDEVGDGSSLVLTGWLNSSGQFEATDVALKG
ncbi:MAG: cytochrome c maturation protein CcmE [Coriobacteriales bacterium]|nr:cytochrome c maturation protein CcmE [Coriobacteriales bacterium]